MDLDRLEKLARSYADISAGPVDQFEALNQQLWGGKAPQEPSPIQPVQPVAPAPKPQRLRGGFEVPGYSRILTNVDQPLQQKSMQILRTNYGKPFGTRIPFTDPRDGQQYMAVIEEHGPSSSIPRPHPGVSLFRSQPRAQSPLQMFQRQIGSPVLGLRERDKQLIQQLDPRFRPQVTELMARAIAAGLRPGITESYRSQQRQNELYEQGRTKPGSKVTGTRESLHTARLAVDIYQLDENGEIDLSPEPGFYENMSRIANRLGITWGGNWPTPDRPHFQYRG
jgi:hypothetical protein